MNKTLLPRSEELKFLQQVQQHPKLASKMNRYETIGSVLKQEIFIALSSDFIAKINEELKQEFLNTTSKNKKQSVKTKYFQWGHNFVALAASLAIIAVVANRSVDSVPQYRTEVITLKQAPTPLKSVNNNKQIPLNTRIYDYIQSHNNSGYSNSETFVQRASYSKD